MLRKSFILYWIVLLVSCTDWYINDVRLNDSAVFDIPLFKSEFSLDQIIDTSGGLIEVRTDQDEINLIFKGDPIRLTPEDILPALPIGIPIPVLDTSVQINLAIVDGVSISKIILANDSLRIGFVYSSPSEIEFSLQISSLTLNNQPFQFNTTLSAGNNIIGLSDPISLSEYELNFQDGVLDISYQALRDAALIKLPLVTLNFDALDFTFLQGKLGKIIIPFPLDSIEIDIFRNWEGGDLEVANPSAQFKASNSFGIPMAIETREMYVFSRDGEKAVVNSPIFNAPISFAYPSFDQIGNTEETLVNINNQNSNISSIVNNIPPALYYSISGIVNPEEISEEIFITKESELLLESELNVPIIGKLENFVGYDTIPLTYINDSDFRQASLHLYTENAMPVEVSMEATVLNANRVIIGNLWEGKLKISEAADPLNASALVNISKNEVPLSVPLLQQLQGNNYLGIKIYLKTTSSESVKVTAKQTVRIFAGIKLVPN